MVSEGKAKIDLQKGIFYNPHMELCRDISSLAVSTLPELTVCDGMSATGVRGIRYALENKNVKSVVFIDNIAEAGKLADSNAKLNNLQNYGVVVGDFNNVLYTGGLKFNFIELDPFGSPAPFLRSALFNLRSKGGFLSATATDMPVLCGAQAKACLINYGAQPLNNYFCHETAARILIGNIARTAAPFKLGVHPLITFSKRHYLKVIVNVQKGSKEAFNSMSQLGFVSFCPSCFKTETSFKPFLQKCACGANTKWAGPLWLGKIFDTATLEAMKKANAERDYKNKKQISSILSLMSSEAEMPQLYYDVHELADKTGSTIPPVLELMARLREKGFVVSRTHFNERAIKTDAAAEEVASLLRP